jgi:hypothetical protein
VNIYCIGIWNLEIEVNSYMNFVDFKTTRTTFLKKQVWRGGQHLSVGVQKKFYLELPESRVPRPLSYQGTRSVKNLLLEVLFVPGIPDRLGLPEGRGPRPLSYQGTRPFKHRLLEILFVPGIPDREG